ncbi:hypothetical protein chiPu_0025389, partial [Chiloscyllium punctatum]|nr:hypothetical protein [Chiloscyllium punctatum]
MMRSRLIETPIRRETTANAGDLKQKKTKVRGKPRYRLGTTNLSQLWDGSSER